MIVRVVFITMYFSRLSSASTQCRAGGCCEEVCGIYCTEQHECHADDARCQNVGAACPPLVRPIEGQPHPRPMPPTPRPTVAPWLDDNRVAVARGDDLPWHKFDAGNSTLRKGHAAPRSPAETLRSRSPGPPVVFCGNVMDTLGSTLYALQAFMAFVVAFKAETHLEVAVMMPPMPATQKGRLQAQPVAFSEFFDEARLKEQLRLQDANHVEKCSLADSEVQVYHKAGVDAGTRKSEGVTVPEKWEDFAFNPNPFLKAFKNIAKVARSQESADPSGAPVRVFVETQKFSKALCAATVFSTVTQHAVAALDFAESVRDNRADPSVRRCAYLYVRHRIQGASTKPISTSTILKGGKQFTAGVPCANCEQADVPLNEYAARVGELMRRYGNLTCLAVSYPNCDRSGCDDISGDLGNLQNAMNAAGHRYKVRNSKSPHRQPNNERQPVKQGGETLSNILQMNLAYNAPLLITEASTLWTDYILMKRAAKHRPSAVMFSGEDKTCDLGGGDEACRGCLFVRGECLAPGMDAHPGAHHPCFSARRLRRLA